MEIKKYFRLFIIVLATISLTVSAPVFAVEKAESDLCAGKKSCMAKAERVIDGEYRLSVPKDGASEIMTRVESIELVDATLIERIVDTIKNNLWLISIILLILYLLWKAIRKNSSN